MTKEKLIKNTEDNTTEIEVIEIEGYKIHTYEVDYIERIKGLYGFVYVTTNLVNGKMYVGQKKIKNKSGNWKEYLGSGTLFKKAIEKHGIENFKRTIIDIAFNKKELDKLERFYTYKFNVVESPMWYNLCYGGRSNSGYKYTEEQIEVLRQRSSGHNNPMYGMSGKLSPSYGKHRSEKTREKLRQAAIRREKIKKEQGYKITEETRKKLSEALSRRKRKTNKVNQYDFYGRFIKTWESAKIAAQTLNIGYASIRMVLCGSSKSAGGYQWRYYSEELKTQDVLPCDEYQLKTNMTKEEIEEHLSKIHSIAINQYTIEGNYIKTYDSAQQAHDLDGHHIGCIRQCCRYERKTHHGFQWFNADDPNQPDKTKIILKEE